MRWKLLIILGLVGLSVSLGLGTAHAQIGVGVNVGSIQVDQLLFAGNTYHLPSIGVVNTGHVSGEYSLRIVYRYQQEELQPPVDWFSFSPDRFHLEPETTKDVAINLRIPARAQPGDYFAFIEAYRVVSEGGQQGGLAIQVAAATKLRFTIKARQCGSPWFFNKWLNWSAGSSGTVVDSSVLLGGQNEIESLSTFKGDDRWAITSAMPSLSERPRVRGASKCVGNY